MPRKPKSESGVATATRVTAESLLTALNKEFPGVTRLGSDPSLEITRLPTGLLALDVLMRGGFARGRHVELYGGYNVGKTAIGFSHMARVQREGGKCCMVDAEGTFDPAFAAQLGVDLDELRLAQQHELENGHRVFDYIDANLRSGQFDVIMLDSIASLLPKVEAEEPLTAATMGTQQALLMSKALRKLTAANKRTVLLFINQTRQAVGAGQFAKQTVTSGGRAMGFYAGTRLEVNRLETLKRKKSVMSMVNGDFVKKDVAYGHRLQVRVEKDKTGATHQADETTLVYDYRLGGFDHIEDLLFLGRKYRLIKKSGASWWLPDYQDDKKAGRPAFKRWLASDPLIAEELQEAIEAAAAEVEEDDEDDE